MAVAFSIVLLSIHLLAMNMASAGPLIAAWLLTGDDSQRPLGRQVARTSLYALALGALLGGSLLIAPSPAQWAAMERFTANLYWFTAVEIGFSAACGAVLLMLTRNERRPNRTLVWLIGAASAANLLYHFPPLMLTIGKLASTPGWSAADSIDRRELVRLSLRPELLAMWLHFTLASAAVAAAGALWLAGRQSSAELPRVCRRLAGLALSASVLQVPVGAWVLVASPNGVREALMGSSLLATGAFLAGLAATWQLVRSLAGVMLGEGTPRSARQPALWAVTVAVCMTATLRLSRPEPTPAAELTHYFSPSGSFMASSSEPPGSFPSAISSP